MLKVIRSLCLPSHELLIQHHPIFKHHGSPLTANGRPCTDEKVLTPMQRCCRHILLTQPTGWQSFGTLKFISIGTFGTLKFISILLKFAFVHTHIYIYVCVCVCVCVHIWLNNKDTFCLYNFIKILSSFQINVLVSG